MSITVTQVDNKWVAKFSHENISEEYSELQGTGWSPVEAVQKLNVATHYLKWDNDKIQDRCFKSLEKAIREKHNIPRFNFRNRKETKALVNKERILIARLLKEEINSGHKNITQVTNSAIQKYKEI